MFHHHINSYNQTNFPQWPQQFREKPTFLLDVFSDWFLSIYHQISDITYILLNVGNWIQANVLGLVLEFKLFCSSQKIISGKKMVLHWNYFRVNIHESICENLESAVTMKPLQFCIFKHNFYLSASIFFFL